MPGRSLGLHPPTASHAFARVASESQPFVAISGFITCIANDFFCKFISIGHVENRPKGEDEDSTSGFGQSGFVYRPSPEESKEEAKVSLTVRRMGLVHQQ